MTAFAGRRFSVFANQSKAVDQECERVGHTEPDAKGRCYRCSERVESPSRSFREHAERVGGSIVSMRKSYPMACDSQDHHFNGDSVECACGTTSRRSEPQRVTQEAL